MRLIPGKTKVKIELFRGVTIGDVVVALIAIVLILMVLLSTFPGRLYIIIGLATVGGFLLVRVDKRPNYMVALSVLRYLAIPRYFRRTYTDKHLLAMHEEKQPGEQWDQFFEQDDEAHRRTTIADLLEKKKASKQEEELLESKELSDTEKNALWREKQEREKKAAAAKKHLKEEKKEASRKEHGMEELMPFTGISDGFIEYGGKYYGTIIEIDPVEFRFFSQFRRDAAIENCFGKILRALRMEYAANIVKIERPILYNSYLDKEYDKLEDLRSSYEKGLLSEEELKARVEIQYDRINEIRKLCDEEKVIQPFYYLALFNIDKHQLLVETENALTALQQGELVVRRLERDRDLAIFLKYSNHLDFDEWEVDKLDPKDYVAWAMPESVSFTSRTAVVDRIVAHQMRVVNYPSIVGDAWLAGVMSIPSTKVVVKVTPMERTKAIRSIDRSLQELRGQLNETGIDSKMIELETHIETLSRLLVTLQQDNEMLLSVNIYITMYDVIRTAEQDREAVEHTSLPVIADMKKTVRRAWSEAGIRLNGMDFSQIDCFIGSQISGYDPLYKDGHGIPSNTVAAMYPWIYARVSDEGGIRLGSNDGVPVFIDFFRRDSERVNSNMVIIGKSGSGKSYGTKSILTNMASEDAKIFILDPENEYTDLAHNLHGKIINVGNATYGRLNPFHIITALDDDESEGSGSGNRFSTHLQFLEEFFRQILPDVEKDALEYLNSLVERLYTNFNITTETDLSKLRPEDYPIFDDLYDLVLEDFQRTNNTYLRTMLQSLMNYVSKFATGGRNATIWNGPSTITTDENFTVFNFQSLLANRNSTIANAQMLLVLKYVDNEIIKNRDYNTKYGLHRKIVVVIDEAHVFIDTKFPIALDFMFQLAKRIRKYNGMQIVITQNIKDFVGIEEIARKSTAIINACQYSFIFGLAPNDMDDLCKLYEKAGGINPVEQDQIVTAPRGHAFTVMSAKSRTSFKIEVPQPLVDMFEQQEYQTHYFNGEEGAQNWEDFVAESREEHNLNLSDRMIERQYEAEDDDDSGVNFSFSEIGADEADALETAHRRNDDFETLLSIEEEPQPEPQPAPSPAVQPTPMVQPAFDISSLLNTIRQEVKREMDVQQQLQGLAPQRSAAGFGGSSDFSDLLSGNQDSAGETDYGNLLEESLRSGETDTDFGSLLEDTLQSGESDTDYGSLLEDSLRSGEGDTDFGSLLEDSLQSGESDTDFGSLLEDSLRSDDESDTDFGSLLANSLSDITGGDTTEDDSDEDDSGLDSLFSGRKLQYVDRDDEDTSEGGFDLGGSNDDSDEDSGFKPKFDIMALLDEQLDSYSEMTLSERMDEIEVDTMEISLDELAAYIKENRKKRGA